MELLKIKSSIDERANALTYHISIVSTVFSGHIVKNYQLSHDQHLNLILISTAQQLHLVDRLLFINNFERRKAIIHRVFIGQARMIAGLWPQFYEQGSLEFFSDKQLEYIQYPDIMKKNNVYFQTNHKIAIRPSYMPFQSGNVSVGSVCSLLAQASFISQDQRTNWVAVHASTPRLVIGGTISLEPCATKQVQFLSLGIAP